MDLKRLYASKEWKALRSELIDDKCAWCKSTESLHLDHKIPFSETYGQIYDEIKSKSEYAGDFHTIFLINKYYLTYNLALFNPNTEEVGVIVGFSERKKEHTVIWMPSERKEKIKKEVIDEKLKGEWNEYKPDIQVMQKIIDAHDMIKAESYRRALEIYSTPGKDDVTTLCKRCHYANNRGLIKCPNCDGFTTPNRQKCFKCEHGMSYEEYQNQKK